MDRSTKPRRSVLGAALLAATLAATLLVFPAAAAAAAPTVETVNLQWAGVTLDAGTLCDFPILWSGTLEGTSRTFYESDGTTIAMRIHEQTEQDTFSANGKTLVGDPYHVSFRAVFENGVRVALYLDGNAERVHLPDGGVLIITGRALVTHPNWFSADVGNSGNNIAAFCAALS